MPDFTFTKLNFLDMLTVEAHKLKINNRFKGIQSASEYLLKVKHGGLDQIFQKKSHFPILS